MQDRSVDETKPGSTAAGASEGGGAVKTDAPGQTASVQTPATNPPAVKPIEEVKSTVAAAEALDPDEVPDDAWNADAGKGGNSKTRNFGVKDVPTREEKGDLVYLKEPATSEVKAESESEEEESE